MACFSAWDIQNCGCGPTCRQLCNVCGGICLRDVPTVTDANGTWTLAWDAVLNRFKGPDIPFTVAGHAGCHSGTGYASSYRYTYDCQNPNVRLVLQGCETGGGCFCIEAGVTNCTNLGGCTYNDTFPSLASPTCGNPMTSSHTFTGTTLNGQPPPVTSATVSIPT